MRQQQARHSRVSLRVLRGSSTQTRTGESEGLRAYEEILDAEVRDALLQPIGLLALQSQPSVVKLQVEADARGMRVLWVLQNRDGRLHLVEAVVGGRIRLGDL